MVYYKANIANTPITYAFRYSGCEKYFKKTYINLTNEATTDVIQVSNHEFNHWAKAGNKVDAFAEFCLSCMPTSEVLFTYNRCIFHAAAIKWKDKAWLITAPSGVGKSTQCRMLKELCPNEFSIINGDKPALECHKEGYTIVHPSPWTGKEGWHGANAAPLAGVILLQRGEKNSICSLEKRVAASGIYKAIFQSFNSEELILKAAELSEMILNSAPVWLLTSHEVPSSTKLLIDIIRQETN